MAEVLRAENVIVDNSEGDKRPKRSADRSQRFLDLFSMTTGEVGLLAVFSTEVVKNREEVFLT